MNLVTGASGFVGYHVARRLCERGEPVRVLVRPESSRRFLKSLGVEFCEGDVRDSDSLLRAVRGCRRVYHVAAVYQLWALHPREMYESNVEGTRRVLEAAREVGVERIVTTSTVGALGIRDDGTPADEETSITLKDMMGHYKRSKFLAQEVALDYARQGVPVVIVNPSAPVGSHDAKPTPTGRMIVDYLKGKMLAYMDTGMNLVDVEDVAEGHILAAERGRVGEKYILGNRNMTLKEIFDLLGQISEIPSPTRRAPRWLVLPLAYVNTGWARWVSHVPPRIPLEGVKMAKKYMWFDSSKAIRELGLPQASIEKALEKAVAWYRGNRYA